MSARKIKKEVIIALQEPDLRVVFKKIEIYNEKELISPLFSAICRGEENIKWHAVSVFGKIVSNISLVDGEASRIIMRRFLWSLNDESGGIGWGAPESMAEIMVHSPLLFREYHHMLLSYMKKDGPEHFQDGNYLELPQLQAGLLWGIGRIGIAYRTVLNEKQVVSDVLPYLKSSEKNVRGIAVWALTNLNPEPAKVALSDLCTDESEVTLYLDGIFNKTTIGQLAKEALQMF